MNRRDMIKAALGVGAIGVNYVGLAADEPLPRFTTPTETTLCMAGSIVFTREEVEASKNLPGLVRVKIENLRHSMRLSTVDHLNRRGWGTPLTDEAVRESVGW